MKMRRIIMTTISFSILLVAGFGIYNILNMTITQKINDIAILKAIGFKGGDVVRIFVQQALIIGFIGIVFVLLASIYLPRLIDRLTPNIDEEKEIARGNVAVAEFFGRVVGASILGISIVVAAAIHAAFH